MVVTVRADELAQWVAIDAGHALPDDNYFHVAPGDVRAIHFAAGAATDLSELFLQPLNARSGVRVSVSRAETVSA